MRTIIYPVDKKYDFISAIKTIDSQAAAIEEQVMDNRVGQNMVYALPWADAADRFISLGIIERLSFTKRVVLNREKSMVKYPEGKCMYYWLVLNKAPLK